MGRIGSELFEFREMPSGTEREFSVSYECDRSVLTATGRTGCLKRFCAFETAAGARYFLEAGVIHRVIIVERPCVTMLTTEQCSIPIFSYGRHDSEPAFLRRGVNSEEAKEIKELLGAIAIQRLS